MTYFNYTEEDLKIEGGLHTAQEIHHQPEVWKLTMDKLQKESDQIFHFIQSALKEVDQVILTGAGSSCFIGYSLSGVLFQQYGIPCSVIPTTDIVALPEFYFDSAHTYLVISFARSGKSPESIAALRWADQKSKKCFHLIITCNEKGALAHYETDNPTAVFSLPPKANDKSLAMTSSYSSMLLCGLFIAYINRQEHIITTQLTKCITSIKRLLKENTEKIKLVARKNFKRAVFLGSGALYGSAVEAALKLQELTNGEIICNAETFLGFRHGPKAVVNQETLVVYLLNNNPYVRQYELDLIESMKKGNPALFHLGISENPIDSNCIDDQIHLNSNKQSLDSSFQPLAYIVPCQLIGFFKSIQLNLDPDNPSKNGAISRVVEGVNIYSSIDKNQIENE